VLATTLLYTHTTDSLYFSRSLFLPLCSPVDVIECLHAHIAGDSHGPGRRPGPRHVQLAVLHFPHRVHASLLREEAKVVVRPVDSGVEPAIGDARKEVVRLRVEVAGRRGQKGKGGLCVCVSGNGWYTPRPTTAVVHPASFRPAFEGDGMATKPACTKLWAETRNGNVNVDQSLAAIRASGCGWVRPGLRHGQRGARARVWGSRKCWEA
jgi:hypothetical protein